MKKPSFIVSLELSARRRRFRLFRELLSSIAMHDRPVTIIDIGGTWAYWRQMEWSTLGDIDVVLLNISTDESVPPPFRTVTYGGCDLSQYADHEFDVVYSNSVLGHVGTIADQLQFAKEIRRIGRSYFVQTPNQHFIIDWRTLVPFFHLLPVHWQAWCFRHVSVGMYSRIHDYQASLGHATRVRNVTADELRRFFPDGTIVRERVIGLTKSFIIHAGFVGQSVSLMSSSRGEAAPTPAGKLKESGY